MSGVGLHKPNDLKVWEKIVLIVGEGRTAGKYVARIENIINGGIVITPPEFVDGSTRLRDNLDITVVVTRQDAAYEFSSRIKQRKAGTGEGFAFLTPPRSIRRVQRRQFVRIDLVSDVSYIVWQPGIDWTSETTDDAWRHSRTIDISAGGVLVRADETLQVDDLVVLRPALFAELGLPATVLGLCRRTTADDHGRLAGLEFMARAELRRRFSSELLKKLPESILEFNAMAQDKLARHLFDRQIELRNKGLL